MPASTHKTKARVSHGSGKFKSKDFNFFGAGSHIEPGVLVFHAENISIGKQVYVGHQTILKGYYKNKMKIGDGSWVGQQCFFHSAGGLRIGKNVGIGPGVKIFTSCHQEAGRKTPILHSPIQLAAVEIGDDCDLGCGAIVLPGVKLGRGVQVGAGAVVTKSFGDYAVIAGVPARRLRQRKK